MNGMLTVYWLWGVNSTKEWRNASFYVLNFMPFWWGHWVHSLESAEICVFLHRFSQITGSASWNGWVSSKFCFFLELEMLEFCRFHGFLVDSLLWICKWKWWCKISCLSVTGKAQNLQKIWRIHVLNAVICGQFCSVPPAYWVCLNKWVFGV